MRIGILTGGGDVPGLNPCIKAVVYRAIEKGSEVVGIRHGWGGFLNFDFNKNNEGDNFIHLNRLNTRTIDRSGGTFLHTSRTNPGKVRTPEIPPFLKTPEHERLGKDYRVDFTPHVLK